MQGNRVIPPKSDCYYEAGWTIGIRMTCYNPDPNFKGWKDIQDKVKNCNLSSDLYPEPHPLIVEKYGYDFFPSSPFEAEITKLAGSDIPVHKYVTTSRYQDIIS